MGTPEQNAAVNEADQKKRSRILAYAIALVWIAMAIAARFIYPELNLFSDHNFLIGQGATFLFAMVAFVINLENGYTTNENWKTYIGIFSIASTVFVSWIWIKDGLN